MTFDDLVGKPLHIDAFDLLAQLPDGCVDLVFCDPPYNIGIFSKMPPDKYLAWCERWIAEASRVLAPNGAFWVVHKDPAILVDLSRMIAQRGRKRINWVTWDKYGSGGELQGFLDGFTVVESLRSFQVMAEFLIYHADEGDWTTQCDRERGFIFEPLHEKLNAAKNGRTTRQIAEESGLPISQVSHYFRRDGSGWRIPSQYAITKMGVDLSEKELRREYEDLRREYEDLRYTFNNPGKVSSVWQIPPAPRSGHPTPKPEPLLARIIEATSNSGDLVLDFFAGSFTTAVVSERLNRRWICGDYEAKYVELGERRLAEAKQLELAL